MKRRNLDLLDAVLDLLSGPAVECERGLRSLFCFSVLSAWRESAPRGGLQIQPDTHSYGLLIEAHVQLKNFNEAAGAG